MPSLSSLIPAQIDSRGIRVPFPHTSHRWSVIALDARSLLARFTASPFHSLRSMQLCSWVTVRSVYTSDMKFSLQVRG